jgi:hypothetical protein
MFIHAKGSEWVWFNRVKKGLDVECIDNRMHIGLPDAVTENVLKYIAGLQISFNPVIDAMVQQIMSQNNFEDFNVVDKIFIKPLFAIFNKYKKSITFDIYKFYIKIMKKQYANILHMIKNKLPHVYINVDQSVDTLFLIEFRNLIKNIVNLSSMMVDFHIIHLLQNYELTKPIAIFVGMNHAIRLSEFLGWPVKHNNTFDWRIYEDYAYETMEPQIGHKGEVLNADALNAFNAIKINNISPLQNESRIHTKTSMPFVRSKSPNTYTRSHNRKRQINKSRKMSQVVQQRFYTHKRKSHNRKLYSHKSRK